MKSLECSRFHFQFAARRCRLRLVVRGPYVAKNRDMTDKHSAPKRSKQSKFESVLESTAGKVTTWTGSTSAFALSACVVVFWGLTGG